LKRGCRIPLTREAPLSFASAGRVLLGFSAFRGPVGPQKEKERGKRPILTRYCKGKRTFFSKPEKEVAVSLRCPSKGISKRKKRGERMGLSSFPSR